MHLKKNASPVKTVWKLNPFGGSLFEDQHCLRINTVWGSKITLEFQGHFGSHFGGFFIRAKKKLKNSGR